MARKAKKAKSTKRTLPHVPAGNYRASTADGATITILHDAVGVTFQVTFTRIDMMPVSETFPATELAGGMQQTGPAVIELLPRKVQEFSVLLRPDHAFQVAEKLLIDIAALDDGAKKRYLIPEFELARVDPKKKRKKR